MISNCINSLNLVFKLKSQVFQSMKNQKQMEELSKILTPKQKLSPTKVDISVITKTFGVLDIYA